MQSGVVSYLATATLDPKAVSDGAAIRAGMTTNAAAVVARASNVLMVPNRAVKRRGRQKYVTVLDTAHGDQQVRVLITTGISNNQDTEVTGCVETNGSQCLKKMTRSSSTPPRLPRPALAGAASSSAGAAASVARPVGEEGVAVLEVKDITKLPGLGAKVEVHALRA